MTQRQIAALAVRILAIYAVLYSLAFFGRFFLTLAHIFHLIGASNQIGGITFEEFRYYNSWSALAAAIPGILAMGFGTLLWIFSNGLSVLIADDEPVEPLRIHPQQAHAIAFSVVGLIVLLKSLSLIVSVVLDATIAARFQNTRIMVDANASEILIALVQIPAGLWLLFGARRLVELLGVIHPISWLRDVGRDPEIMRGKALPKEPPNS